MRISSIANNHLYTCYLWCGPCTQNQCLFLCMSGLCMHGLSLTIGSPMPLSRFHLSERMTISLRHSLRTSQSWFLLYLIDYILNHIIYSMSSVCWKGYQTLFTVVEYQRGRNIIVFILYKNCGGDYDGGGGGGVEERGQGRGTQGRRGEEEKEDDSVFLPMWNDSPRTIMLTTGVRITWSHFQAEIKVGVLSPGVMRMKNSLKSNRSN